MIKDWEKNAIIDVWLSALLRACDEDISGAEPITKGGCEYIRVYYDRFCRDIKVDSDNLLVVVRDVFTAITQ